MTATTKKRDQNKQRKKSSRAAHTKYQMGAKKMQRASQGEGVK